MKAWLARGPGPQATRWRTISTSVESGRPLRTSFTMASTTLWPIGRRRTSAWADIRSPAFSAATARGTFEPVVAIMIWRSAASSG